MNQFHTIDHKHFLFYFLVSSDFSFPFLSPLSSTFPFSTAFSHNHNTLTNCSSICDRQEKYSCKASRLVGGSTTLNLARGAMSHGADLVFPGKFSCKRNNRWRKAGTILLGSH